MEPNGLERRRTPRVETENHSISALVTMRARVVEIGMGGVLLDCGEPVVSRKGRLRMPLGPGRFASDVEVRYQLSRPEGAERQLIGAAFVNLDGESRQALERFLARAVK